MNNELLPCPFCGGIKVKVNNHNTAVDCPECNTRMYGDKVSGMVDKLRIELIKKWNTRATPQPIDVEDIATEIYNSNGFCAIS